MIWCAETEFYVKPWLFAVILDLVLLIITSVVTSWYIKLLRKEQRFNFLKEYTKHILYVFN